LVPVQGKILSPNTTEMQSLFDGDSQPIIKLYYKLVMSSNQSSILKSYTDKHRPPRANKENYYKCHPYLIVIDAGLGRISLLFKRME